MKYRIKIVHGDPTTTKTPAGVQGMVLIIRNTVKLQILYLLNGGA